jgi:hypothetical protein
MRVVDQLTDDADSHNNAKRYKEVVKVLDPRFESSLSIFLKAQPSFHSILCRDLTALSGTEIPDCCT